MQPLCLGYRLVDGGPNVLDYDVEPPFIDDLCAARGKSAAM